MKRPFLPLFLGLASGIIASYYFKINISLVSVIMIIIPIIILLLILTSYNNALLFALFLVCGIFLYNSHFNITSIANNIGTGTILDVLIINEGIEKGTFKSYLEYEARLLLTNEKSLIRVYNYESLEYEVGQVVRIKDFKIKPVQLNNDIYDSYNLHLMSKGIKSIVDINHSNISFAENRRGIRSLSYKTRKYIEGYIDQSLEEREASLLKSIVFGNRGYMQKDMLNHFSRSGTAHIIAISGLHIGLIIIFLERLFKLVGVRTNYIKILTALVLVFYSFSVGFPISIIRASTMYYLYIGAYYFRKKYDSLNALMLIAFILLIINPFVIFSVSFQLSFSATLGIILIYPLILKGFDKKLPKSIGSLIAMTLAAQIATMPILVYHFSYLSIVSLVANLLIVPVIGLLISLAFLSIILGLLPFNIASILNFAIGLLLKYVYSAARIFSINRFSGITIESVELYAIIFYYVIIAVAYYFIKYRRNKRQGLGDLYEL